MSITNNLKSRASKDVIRLIRIAAFFLIVEALILILPLVILGRSINWPASLNEPASINLPLILEQYSSMMFGYSIYLIYSLLFWPVAYLTGKVIVNRSYQNPLFQIANGFAILSVLARTLGIVRWLFTMPVLAEVYTAPNTTIAIKDNLNLIYEMLNSYAGGIGEILGVSLFAATWLILISIIILRKKDYPAWLGYFGLATALLLTTNLLSIIGIDTGSMTTISVVLLQFWMLSTAILFIRNTMGHTK